MKPKRYPSQTVTGHGSKTVRFYRQSADKRIEMMTNKLNPFHAKSMIATALMATMIGVAACGAAATTSTNTTAATQQPTVAASASTTTSVTGTTAAGNASTETAAPETATAKLNLNTATSEEFATVPDVGN